MNELASEDSKCSTNDIPNLLQNIKKQLSLMWNRGRAACYIQVSETPAATQDVDVRGLSVEPVEAAEVLCLFCRSGSAGVQTLWEVVSGCSKSRFWGVE